MAIGSNDGGSERTFLSVGFGKLRQKTLSSKERVNELTNGAVKRETHQGKESWAIEYNYVSGIIESIKHKEDAQYGDSFEVTVADGPEKYQISFPDDSRFWFDFMKKLPNISLRKDVKISVYDFESKERKRIVGCSIEQDGIKVKSFYDKQGDDGKWSSLYGYPSGKDVDWKDKDEVKVYNIRVKKFLYNEFLNRIQPDLENP